MKKLIFILSILLNWSGSRMLAQSEAIMMTYNIKGGSMDEMKAANIAKIINSIHPDVVAVQEVNMRPFIFQHDYLKEIADATGMDYEFLPTVGKTYGIGLLFRTKPLSLQTEIIPFSDKNKDKEDRGMIIAEFSDYYFIGTHYSLNADDRDTATDFILRFTDEAPKTVFVAGDFNAKPTYRAMVTFKNYGFQILNNTAEYTFPSDAPESCIDMIISYSDFPEAVKYKVTESGIAGNSGVDLTKTSDHLPVYIKLKMNGTGTEEPAPDAVSVRTEKGGIRITGLNGPALASVYRTDGRPVKCQTIENNDFIDLSGEGSGIYIITLENELRSHSIKLMFNI